MLLADDHEMIREGLRLILDAEPDISVVAEVASGDVVVSAAQRSRPDVVLMDIRMPGLDGIAATNQLLAVADWPVRVIVVTTFDLDEYVYQALRVGASGFLLKSAQPRSLPVAVREVQAGVSMLSAQLTRRLIERFTDLLRQRDDEQRIADSLSQLTRRELEVLRLIARGRTNASIAAELFLAESTVKTHVVRILQKLRLHDRTQAAIAAYEFGLVTPGGDVDFGGVAGSE